MFYYRITKIFCSFLSLNDIFIKIFMHFACNCHQVPPQNRGGGGRFSPHSVSTHVSIQVCGMG